MKRVYICHPYRSDPEGNLKAVEKIVADIGLETLEKMRTHELKDFQCAYGFNSVTIDMAYKPSPLEIYKQFSDELICPVSAMLAFPAGMNSPTVKFDHEDQELSFCISLLESCDEIWVYSRDLSAGMIYEVEKASELGIKVVWKA